MENGVGRKGPGEISVRGKFRDRRGDDRLFLVAEAPVFPGVRIESGHGNARFASETPLQKLVQKFSDAHDFSGPQGARNFAQWQMNGGQGNSERSARQAHGEVFRSAARGEEFRLPGKGETSLVQTVLGHG